MRFYAVNHIYLLISMVYWFVFQLLREIDNGITKSSVVISV